MRPLATAALLLALSGCASTDLEQAAARALAQQALRDAYDKGRQDVIAEIRKQQEAQKAQQPKVTPASSVKPGQPEKADEEASDEQSMVPLRGNPALLIVEGGPQIYVEPPEGRWVHDPPAELGPHLHELPCEDDAHEAWAWSVDGEQFCRCGARWQVVR